MKKPSVHESYLAYAGGRYLKLALGLIGASLLLYFIDQPLEGATGSSALGYTLGTVAALLILWLAALGVRKRRYHQAGMFRGWVSAHVYLGLALLVIGTLHTGFELGLNIHTLAWLLMVLVISSGVVGIVCYSVYPRALLQLKSALPPAQQLEQIQELNDRAIQLADELGADVHRQVVRSCSRMQLGGGFWRQLLGARRQSQNLLQSIQEQLVAQASEKKTSAPALGATTMFMASEVLKSGGRDRSSKLRQLIDLLGQRDEKVWRLNQEITYSARMRAWLYLHIPLTVALLGALLAHVLVVFLYW